MAQDMPFSGITMGEKDEWLMNYVSIMKHLFPSNNTGKTFAKFVSAIHSA